MDPRELLFLYKETRVNLEPASPATIVHARVPSTNGGRRVSARAISNGADNFAEEERAYRAKNLATASSIFYRKHHDSPRSFLWRVLERGDVLSIRAADVCKHERAPDANLILNLHFPKGIRPSCVAFADPPDHDALVIFVLDESFSLNYLILRPDVFRRRAATENGLGEAWKPYLSAAFNFKLPHRLVAISADEFIVTLHDGGIINFRRDHSHDTLTWKESFHSPVSFVQGLRSILPFQGGPTIKHEGTSMEITAAASAVVASMDSDTTFLFTVCLDHRLRVWNIAKGEISCTGDILGLDREPHEIGKWTIDPSQSNLIRILGLGEGVCLCITYSPVGAGTFMFWKATATLDGGLDIEPYFESSQSLVPPTPSSSDVWTLADFGVSHTDGRGINLWILWKNNLTYRVTKLECTPDNIDRAWESDWVGVFADTSIPTAQASGACDPTDATEKWLQLIFFPGRFSRSSLETALMMYERGSGTVRDTSSKGNKSLAESICSVLGSAATLERSANGGMDYELFRSTSEIQWRRFYRLVVELDKQRGEALSLVVDPDSGLTWVVCTDSLAVIRECNPLDRLYHNLSSPEAEFRDVSSLLTAGATFLDAFSDGMLQLSEAALRSELFEDSSKTDAERIQYLSDKAGFWRQVTEDECSQVVDVLGYNFKLVDLDLYKRFLSLLEQPEEARGHDVRHPFTQFGQKLVIKGVQEEAELNWQILFSQLILLVHMEFEFDQEEDALHSRFDVGLAYREIIQALKRLELVRWLAKSEFSVALSKSERNSISGSPTSARRGGGEDTQVVTALEGSVGHLLGLGDIARGPLASVLTDIITDICSPGSSIELDPSMIQCMLLKRERPDLSLQLGAFAGQDPFSTYIQGRTFLGLRDYDAAASYFKKAAVGLSVPIRHANRHSAGLIDDTEWNLFYNGLAHYYSHIVGLYDRQKAYSFVVDFARLALQFAHGQDAEPTRTELLSRLFTASTAVSRFDLAHSTLLSMTNKALQHSCLKKLVEEMCETAQNAELVTLPFTGLQGAVDDILLQKCQAVVEVARGTPWHQILYAWRISHNDYRGAAAILLHRLQKLQRAGEGDRLTGDDVLDTPVTRQFLLLINTLSCVEPKQAWICTEDLSRGGGPTDVEDAAGRPVLNSVEVDDAEGEEGGGGGDGINGSEQPQNYMGGGLVLGKGSAAAAAPNAKHPWRKVVTLADIRKQYQDELDRIAAIQNNQFDFAVDGDDDDVMDQS